MSIEAIRLKNFRGFKHVALPLKPLTVLLGPNSSGKSSFGHALVALAHCQRRDVGSQIPTLTPYDDDSDNSPIDFGTVQDLRTNRQSGRGFFRFQMKPSSSLHLAFPQSPPHPT